MVHLDGKVSTVVKATELAFCNSSFSLSESLRYARLVFLFGLQGTNAISSGSQSSLLTFIYSSGCHGEFLVLLSRDRGDFGNLHVFKWEIAEAGVGVAGSISILPGLVVCVFLFAKHLLHVVFEDDGSCRLVLADILL